MDARRHRLYMACAIASVLGAGALVFGLAGTGKNAPPTTNLSPAPLPAPQTADLDEAVRLAGAERISYRYEFGINDHRDGAVTYPTNPPTNGPHANRWTPDGNYAGQPAPPTGEVVHAQEHGRIVLQYRPGLPRRTLAQLVALYEEAPHHVLLVENATGMSCPVAATAWGEALLCPEVNDRIFDALRAFRDEFRDQGPEDMV